MRRFKLEDSRNAMTVDDDVEVWVRDGDHFEPREQSTGLGPLCTQSDTSTTPARCSP